MVWQPTLYSLLGFVAAGTCAVIAIHVWHARDDRDARPFQWLIVALGCWSLVYAVQLGFTTLTGQLAWQGIGLAIGGTIPTVWLLFTLRYAGREGWLTRGKRALLAVDPLLFGLLTLTNPYHGLIWNEATLVSTTAGPVVSPAFAVGYYVHILYAYLAIGAGIGLLLLVYTRSTPIYRKQTALLVLGAVLPSAANIAYTLRVPWGPLPAIDPTPFTFAITGVLFGLALFQFDLLERIPLARQLVIEEMGDGLVVLDGGGRIVEANSVAQRALGPSLTLGGSITDLDLDGTETTEAALRTLDGRTVTATIDGRERVYDGDWSSLTDHRGETVGHVLALRDVTDRTEYKQQSERLEEFASIVSHDLRNPLNVAEGRLTLAQEECDSEHLPAVADALDRMVEIVDDTLTLARQGQIVDETYAIDLSDILADCWRNVETDSAALTIADELAVRGDPERLRSLFENLFRNAVEHGGESVTVRVGSLDTDGFYVEDDGAGIPIEERDAVFQPGHSTTDGGTGFGLAIVEQIATAHGWEVDVTSSEDGGARFEISGVELVR